MGKIAADFACVFGTKETVVISAEKLSITGGWFLLRS